MRASVKVLLIGVVLAAVAGPATAQWTHDTRAPVAIYFRDEGGYRPESCVMDAAGNVEITQDRTQLRAQAMVVHMSGRPGSCEKVVRAEADREVFYVTPNERVRADHADYDFAKDTVTFTGGVVVVRGQDVAATERLVINVKTNATRMSGGVKAVIYQEQAGQ